MDTHAAELNVKWWIERVLGEALSLMQLNFDGELAAVLD